MDTFSIEKKNNPDGDPDAVIDGHGRKHPTIKSGQMCQFGIYKNLTMIIIRNKGIIN